MVIDQIVNAVKVEVVPERLKSQAVKDFATSDYAPFKQMGKIFLAAIVSLQYPAAHDFGTYNIFVNNPSLIPVGLALVSDVLYAGYNYVQEGRNSKAFVVVEAADALYRAVAKKPKTVPNK